jgi:hypothetical protein
LQWLAQYDTQELPLLEVPTYDHEPDLKHQQYTPFTPLIEELLVEQ